MNQKDKDIVKFLIRTRPRQHRELKRAAEDLGVSVNALVIAALTEGVRKRNTCEKCGRPK